MVDKTISKKFKVGDNQDDEQFNLNKLENNSEQYITFTLKQILEIGLNFNDGEKLIVRTIGVEPPSSNNLANANNYS